MLPRFLPIRVKCIHAFNNEGFSYLDLDYQANCRNKLSVDNDAIYKYIIYVIILHSMS